MDRNLAQNAPFVNFGIGIGIGNGIGIKTDKNAIIFSSIKPMDNKLSRAVT